MSRFPTLRARALLGKPVRVPDALRGPLVVLVVAFRREQQALVDSWVPFLRELEARSGVRAYELPTISRRWLPLRPVIDGGMAGGIKDPVARNRTLTVYGDVGAIVRDLGVDSTDTIALFLVTPEGRIHWRARGPFDPAAAAGLARAIVEAGEAADEPS